MKGYIYICDVFIVFMKADLVFDDLKNRDKIIAEVKRAFRQCVGVEAEEVDFVRSVMARDWVVLEYEVRSKIAALRARVVFTDGDPAKALEEAERVLRSGGRP